MNLFLPFGIDTTQAYIDALRAVGPQPPAIDTDKSPSSVLIFKFPSHSGDVSLPPLIDIPASTSVLVNASFGFCTLTSEIYFNVSRIYATPVQKIALHAGYLKFSLSNDNGLLATAEVPFDRYALGCTFELKNLQNYTGPAVINYEFVSDEKLPFGPCFFIPAQIAAKASLVEPNQSLIAKTYNIGQQINYGPQTNITSSANLTDAEIIGLRASAEAGGVVFSNAEIDEELNLRASVNAVSTSLAQVLGPVDLNATARGIAAISASAAVDVTLAAGAQCVAGARAVPYIGKTLLMVGGGVVAAVAQSKQNLLVSSRVSGMTLYVNLETRAFITSPVLLIPITQMYFTRRDIEAIDVKFVRDGQIVPLSYGATGQLGIKSEFDGAMLALDSSWAEKGEGANIVYQFSINLNTTEIDDLFVTDDETSVTAKVELSWTEGGTINTTLPCAAIILNDVLRGTEGAPTPATVADYFDIRSDDDSVWRVTVDDSGVLTAQKQ